MVNTSLLTVSEIKNRYRGILSRDTAYAIVRRLPHIVISQRGPHQSLAINSADLELGLARIQRENLVLHDVFCNWSPERFTEWWDRG